MRYLTPQDILAIHAKIIDKTGGSHGVRDLGLLISLSERPKTSFENTELYKSVFEKAAAYFESLVHYHVFVDGNKRTSIVVSARFLFLSGFILVASNEEVEKFVLRVAVEKLSIEKIVAWFKRYSRKIE